MQPVGDVGRTQLERCVLAVYGEGIAKRGLDRRAAVSRAFAICTGSLQRAGYLVEHSHIPTLKGEVRSRIKAKDSDASEKQKLYVDMLAAARKGGRASARLLLFEMQAFWDQKAPASTKKTTSLRGAANRTSHRPLRLAGSANTQAGIRPQLVPLRQALDDVFTCSTAYGTCRKDAPSAGHCMLASMVVQDLFGGCIVAGQVKGVSHYWNRIGSLDVDLTGDQFGFTPVRVKKGALYPKGRIFPRNQGKSLVLPSNKTIMGKYGSFATKLIRTLQAQGQDGWSDRLVHTQAVHKAAA